VSPEERKENATTDSWARRWGRIAVFFGSGAIPTSLRTLVQLVIVPVLLGALGTEGYGRIVVYNLATGVAGLLCVGFAMSLQKGVAERPSRERAQYLYSVSLGLLAILLTLGLVLLAGLATLRGLSADGSFQALRGDTGALVLACAAGVMVSALSALHLSMLSGHQMFLRAGVAETLVVILPSVAMAITAAATENPVTAVVAHLVTSGLLVLALVTLVSRSLGLSPRPTLQMQQFRREHGRFAGWVTGQAGLGYLANNVDRLVVGSMLGLTGLGLYNVAYSAVGVTNQFFIRGPAFLLPVVSARAKDLPWVRSVLARSLLGVSCASALVSLVLLKVGERLLAFWVGAETADSIAPVFLTLLAATPFLSSSGVSTSVGNAVGLHRGLTLLSFFTHGCLVLAVIAGGAWQGLPGLVGARVVVQIASVCLLRSWVYHRVSVMADGRSGWARGLLLLSPAALPIPFILMALR